ncbi:hypothetical protein [Rothia sp. 32237D007AR]
MVFSKKICKTSSLLLSAVFSCSFMLATVNPATAATEHRAINISATDNRFTKEILAAEGIDYESAKEKLAKDFEILFTEVLVQDKTGNWDVNDLNHPALEGLSSDEISVLLSTLNSPPQIVESVPVISSFRSVTPSAIINDGYKYTECVLSGATGLPIPPSLIHEVVSHAKAGNWHAVAETSLRGFAELAASELLDTATKIAFKQFSNTVPGVFAARLVLHSGLCVMYNQ